MPPVFKEHTDGEHIVVSAQQSRYALDAVDAPSSKEILVTDLSVTVAGRGLLNRTTLHLVEARHYVLVGRNGTGKSTLLKAIADGLVPGIASSTKILLLGQTQEPELQVELGGLEVEDQSVLQYVVRSDQTRERLTREANLLSNAIEDSKDAMSPVRAYRHIQTQRLATRLKEAHRVAERRSGARGKLARKELIKLEERYESLKKASEEGESDIDPTHLSEVTQAAANLLLSIQGSLELMDAAVAETKARKVLLGLGFEEDRIDKPRSQLSGGWQTRCNLACALTHFADVLLLDEPTNFLDLPSTIWLQDYINSMTHTTILITTHDRDFGDAVAEELLLLCNQGLETFRGNLSLYERERRKKIINLTKIGNAKDKQKKHIERTIAGNIKAAKAKGDDKKLKQAASRQKKLDERWGMESSAKGSRFKFSRDIKRPDIVISNLEPVVKLTFPRQPPDLQFPGALVNMEKVVFAYPGDKKAPTLIDISLTIHPGTRTGLVGLNGSGKTTLVNLIAGDIIPVSGSITTHPRAKLGHFSQQSVAEITSLASSNSDLTALRYVIENEGSNMEEEEARKILAGLGLHGRTVSDVPLAILSGGQKVRVALAKLLWPPPQLLILDEVTTNLDTEAILSLILALKNYNGALLVITHDRFFMRTVVEGESPYKLASGWSSDDEADESDLNGDDLSIASGTVYRLTNGYLRKLEGGMEQYAELAARKAATTRQSRAWGR